MADDTPTDTTDPRKHDAEQRLRELLAAGASPKQWEAEMALYGLSRPTAWRWKKKIEAGQPTAPPSHRKANPVPQRVIAPPPPTPEEIDAATGGHQTYLNEISEDLRAIRRDNRADKPYMAIAAAQAEASVIMSAVKLAKEMRQAAQDDITMHPQHVRFRNELVKAIQGTDAEDVVRRIVESLA